MKRFKLLLVALATISFTAFYACSGNQNSEEGTQTEVAQDSTTTTEEPQVETKTEVKDSTATEPETKDSAATEEPNTEE